MESIRIYPKNAKQKSLLTSFLEEMKIRFELTPSKDETLFSEEEYFSKINKSIAQVDAGKTKSLPKENQKEFLGL